MPQLQINQGPQDALLYDNSRSYFTNVGYVRTSNFQVEYRKVDPQNTPTWGSTMQFIIPKAADLLGPVDLRVEIPHLANKSFTAVASNAGSDVTTRMFTQWVDELGFAMIEKITFSVGSNDIETITGEELQIRNELMTSDEMRLGHGTVLKTGRAAFVTKVTDASDTVTYNRELPGIAISGTAGDAGVGPDTKGKYLGVNKDCTRLVEALVNATPYLSDDRHLIIPLGLFFTKHVSQYFPLAAVAGCNDIRIAIKLRQVTELVQMGGKIKVGLTAQGAGTWPVIKNPTCHLMCHYVHVTGPEAQTLMNKEHVRLMKLFQHQHETFTTIAGSKFELNLSFLHPVSTLIITLRNERDLNSSQTVFTQAAAQDTSVDPNVPAKAGYADLDTSSKGFFFYHGDGTEPNYDRMLQDDSKGSALTVTNLQLTLNGQERHPGLDKGIDTAYLRERLIPMLHSNSSQKERAMMGLTGPAFSHAYGLEGSKNIFVYPFSLNPEGSNPSGAVNFSKVSHAKLSIHLKESSMPSELTAKGVRVDVYALYYNWLQIKDGRALLSFA
ncbi:MAG: hypothetical protein CMO41_04425 [Verrucomicrobiales bacterium]|nr:hypothetical protein [Verrucomicrobiales bacterium]|tara:strand:+ start:20073 stop:21734 length:1662 start_codon:yes stop_codon:yes gene_type:complete